MRTLAYNIDPLLAEQASHAAHAQLNAIAELAEGLPAFRHLALTTSPELELQDNATGLELVRLPIPGSLFMSRKWAYRKKLSKWLQTNDVAAWITTDPGSVWSNMGAPAVLLANARELLSPLKLDKHTGLARQQPEWIHASLIILPFEADREAVLKALPGLASRCRVILPALEEKLDPITWSEQEQVKLRYSGGRDYFLFAGELAEEQELIHLLKSYSLVKKWLMTGMPLILAGAATDYTPTFEKLLSKYKYRSDVSIYSSLETREIQELVAGAYTLVLPSRSPDFAYPLEWAFAAGTPVLTIDAASLNELAGNATMASPPGDQDQLAHNMMILYKDEHKRNALIEAGRQRAETLNRASTLEQYRSAIQLLLADNG
jgi:glycosyltransferase involved in cell wall biosynthesis